MSWHAINAHALTNNNHSHNDNDNSQTETTYEARENALKVEYEKLLLLNAQVVFGTEAYTHLLERYTTFLHSSLFKTMLVRH